MFEVECCRLSIDKWLFNMFWIELDTYSYVDLMIKLRMWIYNFREFWIWFRWV